MNLQQLEYFKIIAQTKNFTTASAVLSVTQPALSKAISKLEQELDVPLFEREGRNIKLTHFGDTFLRYADSALSEIERGKEKLLEMKTGTDEVLSIASTNCIGAAFMPFLLSSFYSLQPNFKVNINTQSSKELMNALRHERIDFAFLDKIKDLSLYPELEAALVAKKEYVLIVSKKHPLATKEEVSLTELKEESFILYKDNADVHSSLLKDLLGYSPRIIAEPTEANVLGMLVATGAGISITFDTPLINTNQISILKIKEDIGMKSIYMVWNKHLPCNGIKAAFKEHVLLTPSCI